jgi:hypothetical protein
VKPNFEEISQRYHSQIVYHYQKLVVVGLELGNDVVK